MTDSTAAERNLIIRDIETIAEMRQVEQLQKEVWGIDDLDVVPVTHLVAAKAVNGILVGAFDGETMVGFAYGFVGYEEAEMVIHSHMLAVKPAYRNHNLGYKLKLAQRERALALGISRMTWTYDPLQSLNAHFNFGKLGVVADQYKINFYGEATSSFLHQLGTDRLWVSWLLSSQRVRQRLGGERKLEPPDARLEEAGRLVRLGDNDWPQLSDPAKGEASPFILIEIPTSIGAIQQRDPGLAVAWREATRQAFTEAMAAGYLVEDFYRLHRDGLSSGAYLLSLGRKLADFR
jgi:predicted GNAT superfamily acetyltransferase